MSPIDRLIRRAMARDRAPGVAVTIIRDGAPEFHCHGVRVAGGAPIGPETHFALASVSKAFTATACAALVDAGALAWDDPVRKHLPAFRLLDPAADAHVTVRDLLCHRTGLPRHDALWYRSPWGREELLRRMAFLKPTASFRSLYQYNNLCFLAAGEAAAAAAGQPFEHLLRQRILEPLGMEGVSFSAAAVEAHTDRATPHTRVGGKVVPSTFLDFTNVGPAGAMNASAADLARWIAFHLQGGGGLVSPAALAETYAAQTIIPVDEVSAALYPERLFQAYGLGWSRYDWGGELVLSHGGAIDGFRSHLALLPRRKIGFSVLSNADGILPDAVRNGLLDQLLGIDGPDWVTILDGRRSAETARTRAQRREESARRPKGTRPSAPLADYAGTFYDPGYGDAAIAVVDGALRLSWNGVEAALKHRHHDHFATDSPAPWATGKAVQFVLDGKAKPAELRLLDQVFVRRAQ